MLFILDYTAGNSDKIVTFFATKSVFCILNLDFASDWYYNAL